MDSRSGEMMAYTKVVEAGSFTAAAPLLKISPSAVSKLMTRIEERVGVLLFHRSTRRLTVTAEGLAFYESCVRILEQIDEAEQHVAEGAAVPRGLLRINVSVPFGTHVLLPVVPEFARRFPQVVLDIALTEALVDLQREQVDVAVRMGPLADASFRARRIGKSRRAVVASPAYLAAHGRPLVPADLTGHRLLDFSFKRVVSEWPFLIDDQIVHTPVRASMLTNNGETMRQLTLDGQGISRLGTFHIGRDMEEGKLVELLGAFNPADEEDINIIFLNQRHMPLRTRVFIEYLVERLHPDFR